MVEITYENLILFTLIGVNLISLITILLLSLKLRRLLRGKDAKNLEDTINNISAELKDLKWFRAEMEKYLKEVETRLRRSLQGVETVRFNPFKGTGDGGNQSFATTLINENGDGVTISTLYSRERTSIFAKPIKKLKSDFALTQEEKSSLAKAVENTKKI